MGEFWFRKPKNSSFLSRFNIGFIIFLVVPYLLFSYISTIQKTVFADENQWLFEQEIGDLALLASTYDPRSASVLLSMDRISKGYGKENFLETYQWDIENVLQYLSNNPDKFKQLWLQEYAPFIDFMTELSTYKEDLFSLLGKEKKQTYIIALQNTAEKRPNGWFFGSFILLSLKDAKIVEMKIIDSYVPWLEKPGISIPAPDRSAPFLGEDNKITFLASNKFWFTDIDGKNIKRLYDLTYQDDIRGVLFLQSKMFAELLPWFQKLLWEWQFKNATIDLIRWQALPNKKELYFDGVNEYIKNNKKGIITAMIKHFPTIQEKRFIQWHFARVSPWFNTLLQKEKLQTVYNSDNLYLWDYNSSFNKIDTFVHKTMSLEHENKIVAEVANDIIPIDSLDPGTYMLNIQYMLSIPQSYNTFIESLATQYGIWLNSREKHILALFPEWSTRGVLYLPKGTEILSVEGPVKTKQEFSSPFSENVFYILENVKNNTMKQVKITFVLK